MSKKDKTIEKYKKLIKGSKWTKGEIQGFLKLLRSKPYCRNVVRSNGIEELMDLFSEETTNKTYAITDEHSEQGLEWIKSKVLLKRGGLSKTSGFSDRYDDILRNFSRFEFVGIHEEYKGGYYGHYSPIYRIHSTNGDHVDYSPSHWEPVKVAGQLNPI